DATFSLERRTGIIFFRWGGATTITDRYSNTSSTYDLDADAGEFLVKRMSANHNISAGERLRIRPENPPAGYEWVTSRNWVDSNTQNWEGSGNNRTLDFGDFRVRKVEYGVQCEAGY